MRRRNLSRLAAGLGATLSVMTAAGALTLGVTAPAKADVTSGLILRYKLDETSGTVVHDSSGLGHDGIVYGAAAWKGADGLSFDGSDTYVQVPNNIMSGLSSITVDFDVWIDPGMGKPYFLYGFGNSSNGRGNGYLFSTGNQFRAGITNTDFTAEQQTRPGTSYQLARGMWKHVTYTQTGSTGVLYENGVQRASNTAITLTPGSIGGGVTTADYIGRSLYATDLYFKGSIRDFRVYNRALAPNEVAEVANRAAVQWQQLQALADNNGALAVWQANNTGVVGGNGAWMRFPADYPASQLCGSCLVAPAGWTSQYGVAPTAWPVPDVMDRSQFTQQQISDIEAAVVAAVQPTSSTLAQDATYKLTYYYDGPSDRIVVQTNAPSSLTNPLTAVYPNQVVIQAAANAAPADRCTAQTRTAGEASTLTPVPLNGVSDDSTDLEWQQLQALRDYNCALDAFEDPNIGPVLIFPSDAATLTVANPPWWVSPFGQKPTDWPVPTTARSAQFTLNQIKDIQAAVVQQLSPQGASAYEVAVRYDGMSDRVIVQTNAPSSVTAPLVTAYPNQVVIQNYTPPTAAPEQPEQSEG